MSQDFKLKCLSYVALKVILTGVQYILITYDYPDGTNIKASQEYCLYCFYTFLFLGFFISVTCFLKRCKRLYGEEVHTFAAFLWLALYLSLMYENDPSNIHSETSMANESLSDDPIPDNKNYADDDARKGNYRFIILVLSVLVLIVQSCLLKFLYHIYALYNTNHGETVIIPPGNENVLNPVYDPPPTYSSAVNFENEREPVETPPPLYDDLPKFMHLNSDDSTKNEPPPPPNSPATPPSNAKLSKKNYQDSLDSTPSTSSSTDREKHSNRQLPPRKSSKSSQSTDEGEEYKRKLRSYEDSPSLSTDQEEHSNPQFPPRKFSESAQSSDQEEEKPEKLKPWNYFQPSSSDQKKRSNPRGSGSTKSPQSPPKPSRRSSPSRRSRRNIK